MRKFIFFLLFLYTTSCIAQTYKHISVEDGLSNRRVYAIQKGPRGYMWFLTHDGIDRYDGKEFKQYKLMDGDEEVNSMMNMNWLYVSCTGKIIEIGKRGRVFCYNPKRDRFQLLYKLSAREIKGRPSPISYGFVDANEVIWLCNEEAIYLYNSNTQKTTIIRNKIGESITDIEQIDSTHFFIGTDKGIHHAQLANNVLSLCPCDKLDNLKIQTNELYFHQPSQKLFIGTFQRGIYVYDMNLKKTISLKSSLIDVSINRIKAFNNKEILIATDESGVYKMNTETYISEPYIVADYSRNNAMNGNTIYDVYLDDERIWMANYPIGITVRNNRYADYNWIKHSIGNKQSLINDQINSIIEDQEGDLWFGTTNGISLYNSKTNQWHSFLSMFEHPNVNKNHIFISLCEVAPGIIWAGGYSSGIYQINKKDLSVQYFSPSLISNTHIRPDKYIRVIMKASDGKIWSGGHYNLKEIDLQQKKVRLFPRLNAITSIIEKDKDYMWIGTATGLYLLNKQTGKSKHIQMPVESLYIYSLYQAKNGLLYIGTSNSGLLAYNIQKQTFNHYHKDNCALISNNICTILSNEDKYLLLSTENGLSCFYPTDKLFHNWTKEQGLMSDHFNATSGTLRKNGKVIFGSTNGAIEFDKSMKVPWKYKFKMMLSDLRISYQTVYPEEKDSPLNVDINETQALHLKYNQNIFSIRISSINYDYPSLILYSWKLEGFYDNWSRPGEENQIRFTNLSPGEYTLHIRAVSNEDRRIILEERSMQIYIEQPFWFSIWALVLYATIIILITSITLRIIALRKQRKISDDKIHFFINTAHDIRTPLTLIQAPLENLSEEGNLTDRNKSNITIALRNVNALLRLTTTLINFERADIYTENLYISEYELGSYIEENVQEFRSYALVKHINLTYENDFRYLSIWLDKDKMDSILKNIFSNAMKYTPENGSVHIFASETENSWSIEVKDTGIGIPASEQNKLFKRHFRGSNAINSKITGSGIGLLLVEKLVSLHRGKINFSSTEGKGFIVKITFPKDEKYYRKAIRTLQPDKEKIFSTDSDIPVTFSSDNEIETMQILSHIDNALQRILIAEDNDDLRGYLQTTLSDRYNIQVCSNGKQALTIIKEYMPDMVISDIMMPEMRGDELCNILKTNIETSHIPIILLTALNEDKDIIDGLKVKADEYIVKPFNIGILRATIESILANRMLLRQKYANLELCEEKHAANCPNCASELDWKFISTIKKSMEEKMDDPSFRVDTLCNILNMSRTSFYTKMKALTGQAPADYVRIIRLKRAAELLKEQQYSITEIAEMTGFSDAKYFREVFKKKYNISPSQYAKKGKKG